jgi:hypothetical protein
VLKDVFESRHRDQNLGLRVVLLGASRRQWRLVFDQLLDVFVRFHLLRCLFFSVSGSNTGQSVIDYATKVSERY